MDAIFCRLEVNPWNVEKLEKDSSRELMLNSCPDGVEHISFNVQLGKFLFNLLREGQNACQDGLGTFELILAMSKNDERNRVL